MEQSIELPGIYTRDLRGHIHINFKRPHTYLAVGQRDSGKSTLIESLSMRYPKVIDLFGSRDCEALAWCRSPLNKGNNILFIIGDSAIVDCQWNTVKISQLRLSDFERYDLIITVPAFYSTRDEEYRAYDQIVKLLYSRIYFKDVWFLLIREAANFIYSRIKITKDQHIAKADFIHTLREARHVGLAVGVDTIRWTSIDKELRDVSDFFFIKRVGSIGLPDELRFIYSFVEPYALMNLKPQFFVILASMGALGYGKFDYVTWHKEEGENILGKLGIRVSYKDVPDYGSPNRNTVSDFEHAEIIEKYLIEKSMNKVAKLIKRSPATVHAQVNEHNNDIANRGECLRCRRIEASCSKTVGRRSYIQSARTTTEEK